MTFKPVVFSPEQVEAGVQEFNLPRTIADKLTEYLVHRRYPGRLITYALVNDFVGVMIECQSSCPEVQVHLAGLAHFLRTHAPSVAWGSIQSVRRWLSEDSGDETPGPRNLLFQVSIGGRPIGICAALSESEARTMGMAYLLGMPKAEALQADAETLLLAFRDWLDGSGVSPDDLCAEYVCSLSVFAPTV